jgi:hypothetical protein
MTEHLQQSVELLFDPLRCLGACNHRLHHGARLLSQVWVRYHFEKITHA